MDVSEFSLSRVNLSQQVADHLEEVILSSPTSRVSEKLPSEMKLAKQYNVSRPVIREALKLLQERGLVSLKNGSGAYITKPETDTVMTAISRIMQVDKITPGELTELRGILEMSSVELAAEHVSAEQLAKMHHILDSLNDKSLPLKERVALDVSFHIAIAEASGNELLAMFVEVLTSLLKDYMGKGILIQGGIDDAIDRHRKILDALTLHDVKKARQAMTEHLQASSDNVQLFDSRAQKKEK
jgi:DNA-binding FadR family transcriptional regulator